MTNPLLSTYLETLLECKLPSRIPGRFYSTQPLAIRLHNIGSVRCYTNDKEEVLNDLLFDLRCDGKITHPSLLRTRATEIAQQKDLTMEKKLYPSDRIAIWAKMVGYSTVREAADALGNDLAHGEAIMAKDGVPEYLYDAFVDDTEIYPMVGLSYAKTLGNGMRKLQEVLIPEQAVWVDATLNNRVRVTNTLTAVRDDGQPSEVVFPIQQQGMLLMLSGGASVNHLDMSVYFNDIEGLTDLPFQITRYAILHELMCHQLGVLVGGLNVFANYVYRTHRNNQQDLERIRQLESMDIYVSAEGELKASLSEYTVDDFVWGTPGNLIAFK